MRRALLLCLMLAACTPDPVSLLPAAEREAAAKPDGPMTVEQMLARARTGNAAPATVPGRLLVRFEGDAAAPDAGQRDQLRKFAAQAGGGRFGLMVASRPGSFEDAATPVLGQRRAVAVARELAAVVPDVEMKFDPALPPGVVVVTQVRRP